MTHADIIALLLISWGAKNHDGLEKLVWRLEARSLSAQLKEATEYTKLCNERLESAIETLLGVLYKLRDDAPSTADHPGRLGMA